LPYGYLTLALLCLPYAASAAIRLIGTRDRRRAAWLMAATALACVVLTGLLYPAIANGGVVRAAVAWLPGTGLDFALRVDGLGWLFALLVCGIGFLVGVYARYYMPPDHPLVRFFSLLLAFMGSMLGVVLAGNLIQLVFFWELTSLFSFLLVGYWYHGESARDAARTTLIVTAGGGLALLAGVLLLGHLAGGYDLDAVLAAGARIQASPLYVPALVLVAIGALSKSAQFPFHFWLPQAMSAPTPVSAYLHSATLVNLGVFLLLRLWPALAGTDAWFWLLGSAGMASLLVGGWSAIFQHDLKGILAYSTVSHIGLITMLLGLGSTLGAVAAIFHLVNHATFKASMFMAAGAIDNETGTRDLRRLGGLRHVMPITTTLALIAGAAMAGVPLLNGFLSKEMFFAATLGSHNGPALDAVIVVLAVVAMTLSVTYSLRLLAGTFFGRRRDDYPRTPHEPPRWMRFPIGFLALACLAVGVFPARSIGAFLANAARAVLGPALPAYDLAIWHGFTWPLLMSAIALVAGGSAYLAWRGRLNRQVATPFTHHVSARHVFEGALVWVTDVLPRWQQRVLPSRRLQPQVAIMLVAAGAAVITSLGWRGAPWGARLAPVDPAFALLWAAGGACALGAAATAKFHRLAALILTGGAGLVVCVTFVWLAAPDLAITQLVVEGVTTILILLGLRWLPKRRAGLQQPRARVRWRRRRDAGIAVLAGAGLAALAFVGMQQPVDAALSRFFLRQALPAAGGHNVVNVILVDFRAFDTFGEITVLAIVALTVFGLLRRFRPAAESVRASDANGGGAAHGATVAGASASRLPDYIAVPAFLVAVLAPFMVLFALHLFLRGHDFPGGGFAAGVAATTALMVLYMAHGARRVEARVHVAPVRWIALGLALVIATGAGAIVAGRPFLTSHFGHVRLPVLGELPLASALLFDLGVFAVVVGACTLILIALAHQALRRPHAEAHDGAGSAD
jgi:multicomponent K+:H+ antiporter subunit A